MVNSSNNGNSRRSGRGHRTRHHAVLIGALGLTTLTTGWSWAAPEDNIIREFVPQKGIQEFSGQMIARPIQPADWRVKGISDAQAKQNAREANRLLKADNLVIEYVRQTDEYIIRVPEGETENSLANELMSTGLFQYVEPDWIVFPIGCPNDSRFGNQWHHDANIMQSCDGWDIDTGNPSVGVGICDTGIRTSHEDFQQHRREGYNAVDREWESQGGNIGAVHPHGTMTTGCAAANGDNGVGVSGVGWDLSHRMLRVSNSSGGSSNLSTLQHAARTSIESGDKVASVSYSGVDNSSNLSTASYIKSIGGLLVWAAGNDNRNLTYGNRDNDDIIVAGATDSNDNKAYFSAYGQFVDVVAPGVSVYTTDSGSNSDYAYVSGTSFACPLTAGLCALIWSADPSLTPDEVEAILKAGVDDLGSNGVDNTYGYGRINVYGSLSQIGPPGNTPPTAVLSANPTTGTIPLVVDFDASASFDSDGSIVDFSWDYDGDGLYDQSTGTSPFTQATYTVANQYNATVRVTDDQGATDTDSVLITANDQGGGDPESLAFDGFESRGFSGGTGSWDGSWFGGGDVHNLWDRENPHSGSGHVRMRRGNAYMERVVDLSGATDVTLSFWAKMSSFEASDHAEVWVSSDGVNYTRIFNFVNGDDDNQYHYYEYDL